MEYSSCTQWGICNQAYKRIMASEICVIQKAIVY